MAGLYDTAAPLMDEARTNAHWKREQDNYLTQIGAMELIKRDPMASLGYKIRSANPNRTLEMGGNIDEKKYYGLYKFTPKSSYMHYKGPRFDGAMDVSVTLPPQHYGATIAHELGHVGSRNSQSDAEINSDPMGEEMRQRLVDYVNNPPDSQAHKDALWFLSNQFGFSSMEEVNAAADRMRAEMGLEVTPKSTPKVDKEVPAPAQKKKKAKRKAPAGTNPLKDN